MKLTNSLTPSSDRSVAGRGDQRSNRNGGVPTVKPAYEIKESADAFGLTVHLPGVTRDGLDITAEEGVLRISGQRQWKRPESWTQLYRESTDVAFELLLSHDNAIDVEKIHAELKDGVLRVALPKTEAIKPRKIPVG